VIVVFAAHGATVLVLKTAGPVHDRSLRIASQLWKIIPVLLVVITLESWHVRPEFFSGMIQKPFGWLGLIAVVGAIPAIIAGLKSGRELCAVIASGAFITGLMIAGSAGVFPIMLHSTLAAENSLSAYQNAADGSGLVIALVWWPLSLIFTVVYFTFIYRYYAGKVKPSEDIQNPY
jgi:cytochrome d ubiquinol oxidase subunit II